MSRITDELNRIKEAKASLKVSIENKGVTVDSAATLDEYSGYVDLIQTGTGKPEQVKTYTATTNSIHTITPDEGYVMTKVTVDVDVASGQTQTKDFEITTNGTSDITVDEGYVGITGGTIYVNVPTGTGKPEQVKTLSATTNGNYTITPDEGYVMTGATVEVNVDTTEAYNEGAAAQKAKLITTAVTANGTYATEDGYSSIDVNVPTANMQDEKEVYTALTSHSRIEINPSSGYDGMKKAIVYANVFRQSKTVDITENGTTNLTVDSGYAGMSAVTINVNVPTGGSATLQEKTYTSNGTYTPDEGYDGISKVTINVPTTYSGETITVNFANSGGSLDDLKGKAYVEIDGNQYTYSGSAVTVSVLPGKTYTITYGSVDKYLKPADVSRTTLWGGKYSITGSYTYLGESMVTTDTIYYGTTLSSNKFQFRGANVKSSGYTDIGYVTLEASADTITIQCVTYPKEITFCVIPEFDETKTIRLDRTFSSAGKLASVDISHIKGNVRLEDTFDSCTSLTSIELPSGVIEIGYSTFEECTSLTSINIPSGVTSLGQKAFSGCTSLTSIGLPSGLTSIGVSAFTYCTSLTSIELPSGVTEIGNCTFSGCTSLTSIGLPSGLTSIGVSAFYGCTSLTSIEIPSGVTEIGSYVFYGCTSLTSVTITAVTPPTIGTDVFTNAPVTIYVPAESVDAYKTAWSGYASLIQPIS